MSQTFKITNGDVVISAVSGKPSLVSDSQKLRQDLSEFFTVNMQPSGFGAGLDQLIGIVESSSDLYISLAYRYITNGIANFIRLQKSDTRIPRSSLESISKLGYINIQQDSVDKTTFRFVSSIITVSNDTVQLTGTI